MTFNSSQRMDNFRTFVRAFSSNNRESTYARKLKYGALISWSLACDS